MVVRLSVGQGTAILRVPVLPSIVEYNQLDKIHERSSSQPMYKRNELLLPQRLLLLLLQRIMEEKGGKEHRPSSNIANITVH